MHLSVGYYARCIFCATVQYQRTNSEPEAHMTIKIVFKQ
jgi:hypothetical protein